MAKQISPAQETRLGELAHDFELALAIPVAAFGGEKGRQKQLERIASGINAVFSGSPVTFSNDAPEVDQSRIDRYLAATPLGRQVLRARGVDSNSVATGVSSTTALDHYQAQGEVARPEVIDRMLAGSPIGRQVLADRAKKAREAKR